MILLTIDQPFTNHNGGQLQFGPDGDLYIGMGDGGRRNDPAVQRAVDGRRCSARCCASTSTRTSTSRPTTASRPTTRSSRTTGPPEAWAYGLRNPWRFSFDRLTGDLYIGDVGQDNWEEVDFEPASSGGGQNYGWKIMEGTHCNSAGAAGCVVPPPACGDPAYTLPVLEYAHDDGRCAVTGGYVYRGTAIPDLKGSYVYGDFCTGEVWSAAARRRPGRRRSFRSRRRT